MHDLVTTPHDHAGGPAAGADGRNDHSIVWLREGEQVLEERGIRRLRVREE